jgi:hypothetical protein
MSTLRGLGSLKITVTVLVALAAILIAATWTSGYDISIGALRRDFYGSWWFNILLGLLMVNLVACTVVRKPWRFWQWGFLLTHTGVLTLMVGAGISFNWKIYGDMAIQEGSSASAFEIEGEREIVVRTTKGERRFPVDVNPYRRSRPARDYGSVRLEEYVPHVSEEAAFASAPHGRFDVIEIATHLDGKLLDTTFVPAGETIGNALLSFAYTRPSERAMLLLAMDGETRELDVTQTQPVRVGRRDVTIRRVFRSFTIGEHGPQENDEAPDANPAVAFDVDGVTYYAFALHPEISPMRKGMHGRADFEALFRHASRHGVVYLFAGDDGWRYAIGATSGAIRIGERVRHPRMPRPLEFEIARRIEHAEPTVVEALPRKGRPTRPAVHVRLGGESTWLRLGEAAHVGDATVEFAPRMYAQLGFAVELVRFTNPPHEGTGRASKFESALRIHDGSAVVEGKTGVNTPFHHRGWTFYQSAYNDKVAPVVSILQVAHDPGKVVLYVGCLMTAFGAIFMLLLKRRLTDAVQPTSVPMWFGGVTLGCAGSIALLAAPWVDALTLGAVSAIVGIAFPVALARKPSLGHAAATAWCINAAALAVFVIARVS